jgi:hypothetical protein
MTESILREERKYTNADKKAMAEIGVIPMERECQNCGSIYEEGWVRAILWPLQKGMLCPKCCKKYRQVGFRESDGYTWVERIDYLPTPFKEWHGNCNICNAFPCKHVEQDEQGGWRLVEPDKEV